MHLNNIAREGRGRKRENSRLRRIYISFCDAGL